jgi:hypothetical protein
MPGAWLARRGVKRVPIKVSSDSTASPNAPATKLVELFAVPAPSTATQRYVLQVEGARVEFGDDFKEHTLRRVLDVLRSC